MPFRERRMSVRRRWGPAAAALLLAAVPPAAWGQPRCGARCGTAVIVTTADADMLLPPLVQGGVGTAVTDQIFLKLADIGLGLNTVGDSGFVPRLARSWKFEDPLTLTFTLDPRARWQDGVPVTAADVAFTFDVYRDTLVPAHARPLLERIASVTARDDRTAVFHFRHAYAEQFYDATHQMRILPRHLLDTIPRARLASHPFSRHPVGDGPYRLALWKTGESLELDADSAFFQGAPGLARVIWSVSPDFNSAITQLVSGQADLMDFIGGPENIQRVSAAPQLRVLSYPSSAYVYLGFNLWNPDSLARPDPILGNRDFRRALFQGVDRTTLLHAVLGDYGKVPVGPVSRLVALGNDTTIPQPAFDPAEARATLDRLGWKETGKDGIRSRAGTTLELELLVPGSSQIRRRAAVILQDQLKQIGVGVRIVELEFNFFQQRVAGRKFRMALLGWGEDPSPAGIKQTFTSDGIGRSNYQGYRNPRFDRLVDEAVDATDPVQARAKWREAYSLINADAPGIWLFAPTQPAAVQRRFENVTLRPDQWTATLWTWRVAPGQQIERDRVPPAN